jgi:LAO/AO transport system kinase
MIANGGHDIRRKEQALDWMHFLLDEGLRSWFYHHPDIINELPHLTRKIQNHAMSPTAAASMLLNHLEKFS